MDRNYSFSLLVWDYLRSPAKNLSFLQTIWLIRRDITCDYCYEWFLMVMITITIDDDYHEWDDSGNV